jgi:hypothetical protein
MRQQPLPPRDERGHHALAELAKRQHGVVSVRQLRGLGYSQGAIQRAVGTGRLHRLHRGVYAVGHTALSWHGHCLAAVLASGAGALASHTTAGWLWGLLQSRPGAYHATAPAPRASRSAFRLHRARILTEEDRVLVDGIPVTAIPRTLLDLAATLPERRLGAIIDRTEWQELLDLSAIEALLARTSGHPGYGRLRRAVALYRPEPAFVRSVLEQRFLDLIRGAGLPDPSMNHFVEGYELDAYWPEERFAVELDGYDSHRTRKAFEEDRRRQEDLKLAGIEVLRVTSRRLSSEPRLLAERVETLLRHRRAAADAPLHRPRGKG